MPVRKKQRVETISDIPQDGDIITDSNANSDEKVVVQLVDEKGVSTGSHIVIPVTSTTKQLDALLDSILDELHESEGDDGMRERIPHAFFLNGELIKTDVRDRLHAEQRDAFVQKQLKEGRRFRQQTVDQLPFTLPEEVVLEVVYKPQANFKVRPVTRCGTSLDGHSEAVLVVTFSPDGRALASGGGDKEVRIWDVDTMTPVAILKGHKHWVQVLSWSPDGSTLVSGSRDGTLLQWSHAPGEYERFTSKTLRAHNDYVTHVAWEPFHVNPKCERFVSASKEATCRMWHVKLGLQGSLSGHGAAATCVKWGGEGRIYSSSQDKTIIVWDAKTRAQVCRLRGHAHWVNYLALNTDGVIRTGQHDENQKTFEALEEAGEYARQRYERVVQRAGGERLVSCSDDNTLFLWDPDRAAPLARMTGHQGAVYSVAFSPDGTIIASCSADKSVRLWSGVDGRFITALRGHVAAVYHVSWSIDSRMLVSGSKDTTLKLWSVANRDLVEDLTGHEDEVFSTDWAPDGQRVATGSKDKTVRIWVH